MYFGVFATLTCIDFDAFVCLDVFVTLTPMRFLLFFAVLKKSTKQLGLNVGAIRMSCLFFMFSFCNIDADEIGRGRSGKEIVQNLLLQTDQFHGKR